jgi:hypothetical protein
MRDGRAEPRHVLERSPPDHDHDRVTIEMPSVELGHELEGSTSVFLTSFPPGDRGEARDLESLGNSGREATDGRNEIGPELCHALLDDESDPMASVRLGTRERIHEDA